MPTVAELTALYSNFMLGPRPGRAVCEICFDLTDGRARCLRCEQADRWLDAVVPISYSVAHEQLHHALAGYKRPPNDVARRFELGLAAVLWRYLVGHETCVAAAAKTAAFELVTTVPSSTPERDTTHPLHRMVGEVCAPTRGRFERVLRRSRKTTQPRSIDPEKFEVSVELSQVSVLLIDDTWTSGANVQSAAQTLKSAGAARVAAVVIGRHLHREWERNDRRLRTLPSPFDWSTCPVHGRSWPAGIAELTPGLGPSL
jgi:predicted amidophosphoribosyltransferase